MRNQKYPKKHFKLGKPGIVFYLESLETWNFTQNYLSLAKKHYVELVETTYE